MTVISISKKNGDESSSALHGPTPLALQHACFHKPSQAPPRQSTFWILLACGNDFGVATKQSRLMQADSNRSLLLWVLSLHQRASSR